MSCIVVSRYWEIVFVFTDHVTELRLAQDRIKELDTVNVSQKVEVRFTLILFHNIEQLLSWMSADFI